MSVYEPINTLKPVADGLWIIDGPEVICGRLPVTTRATVIRLNNGDLWVHSPTELTDGLKDELQALGPVRHLVSPSWSHHVFIADWQAAYPDAKTWAVARGGDEEPSVAHDQVLGGEAIWGNEIDHLIVEGSPKYREAAFFHRASASLIVTDLIQNIETARLPVWMRPLIWFAGCDDSDGKMPYLMRLTYREDPMMEAVKQMIAWEPRALILAHGRWYRVNGMFELQRAFRRQFHRRRLARAIAAKP